MHVIAHAWQICNSTIRPTQCHERSDGSQGCIPTSLQDSHDRLPQRFEAHRSALCRSQHTLPVTSICIGSGATNVILASVSLDRTCKLWSLAQGAYTRLLPSRSALAGGGRSRERKVQDSPEQSSCVLEKSQKFLTPLPDGLWLW